MCLMIIHVHDLEAQLELLGERKLVPAQCWALASTNDHAAFRGAIDS
jgi:hypothetical protein